MAGGASTGTITFLFTDIEGHTPLWERFPDEMSDALAAHDAALRRAVESNGGEVVKSEGDAIMATFADPVAAVAAAVAGQEAVTEIRIDGRPLRVRMGLHAGTAERRDDDYFGTTVIRAARLADAAHGGQLVASGAVAALVPDVEWTDLGRHELKGLSGSEHVFQWGSGSFPALRSAGRPGTRLPRYRTTFVGRGRELDQIADLVRRHPLVTLTAVGGTGKTRLAIAVAEQLAAEFDAVDFVDLTAADEGTVDATFAAALGVSAEGGGDPRSEVVARLSGQRHLLVVDNCEHLLDAVAELVDDLLLECDRLAVLATSREALHVEGEQVWRVASLDTGDDGGLEGDAARLFVDRARLARHDFDPSGHEDAIIELVARLDGIPLAIELAAARISHLAPRDLADHLDDRFTLLTGGRARIQRQQTLEAALDWSHDLLTDEERRALRWLSVFHTPFTLEAAVGVLSSDEAAVEVDVVRSLTEKSLLSPVDGEFARYRLLETVRLYAQRRLHESGEVEQARSRHRDWFVAWLESQPESTWLPTRFGLGEVTADLAAAIEWCKHEQRHDLVARFVLRMYEWAWRMAPLTGRAWAQWALEGSLTPSLRLGMEVCVVALGWSAGVVGDVAYAAALGPWSEQLVGVPDDDSAGLLASAVLMFAAASVALDADALNVRANDTIRRAQALGADATEAEARTWRATGRLYRGDVDGAAREAAQIASSFEAPLALGLHAHLAHILGRNDEALTSTRQLAIVTGVREDWEHSGDEDAHANLTGWAYLVYFLAALAHAGLGDLDEARRFARIAVEIDRSARVPVPLVVNDCAIAFAAIAVAEGRLERATELLGSIPLDAVVPFRSPGSMAVYQHYVGVLRERLDREVRHRSLAIGRASTPAEQIDIELAASRPGSA